MLILAATLSFKRSRLGIRERGADDHAWVAEPIKTTRRECQFCPEFDRLATCDAVRPVVGSPFAFLLLSYWYCLRAALFFPSLSLV